MLSSCLFISPFSFLKGILLGLWMATTFQPSMQTMTPMWIVVQKCTKADGGMVIVIMPTWTVSIISSLPQTMRSESCGMHGEVIIIHWKQYPWKWRETWTESYYLYFQLFHSHKQSFSLWEMYMFLRKENTQLLL